jgi:hypothetical protein
MPYRSISLWWLCSLVLFCDGATCAEVFKTPAEVHAACRKGFQEKNLRAVCSGLTPDSLDVPALAMVLASVGAKQDLAKKTEPTGAERAAIVAVLTAHGLSERDVNWAVATTLFQTPDQRGKTYDKLLSKVKHKPLLFADLSLEMKKAGVGPTKDLDLLQVFDWLDVDLPDLQIAEDEATARLPGRTDGKKRPSTIQFKKTNTGWLIHWPG